MAPNGSPQTTRRDQPRRRARAVGCRMSWPDSRYVQKRLHGVIEAEDLRDGEDNNAVADVFQLRIDLFVPLGAYGLVVARTRGDIGRVFADAINRSPDRVHVVAVRHAAPVGVVTGFRRIIGRHGRGCRLVSSFCGPWWALHCGSDPARGRGASRLACKPGGGGWIRSGPKPCGPVSSFPR